MTNEYPAYDRMAERGEMIVPTDAMHGPVGFNDLREYLSYVLPEGFTIEHDDETDEVIICTGLVMDMGGELSLLETDD